MFVQILEQVTAQLYSESGYEYIYSRLDSAIKIWCNKLEIPQEITDYILRGYCRLNEIQELTHHLYKEWQPKEEEEISFFINRKKTLKKSKLYFLVTAILNRINVTSNNMKIIAIIAFIITAVGNWIYIINRKKQQAQQPQELTHRTEVKQHEYVRNIPSPPIKIIKQFLVLVIPAEQSDVINSIAAQSRIDFNHGEQLYEVTKSLWLGSETDFHKIKYNLNRYLVSEAKKSEYDIKLVYLELKQNDEGFQPNVNQLERYDAFRKLSDLVVDFEISPRLQMEAYENFEVYSR